MRYLSNLIKSGRVIDIGTPVNVGVSCVVSSMNNINLEKTGKIIKNEIKKEKEREEIIAPEKVTVPPETIEVPTVSKEEIMEQYIKEAEIKAKAKYEEEMQKAFDEGMEKAKLESENIIEQAKLQYDKILEEIVKIKEDAINEYKNDIKSNEREIVELAMDIAEKIINYEVDKSDNYILGIVEDAVNRVVNKKDVTVRLSTQDYYTIQANKKILVSRIKGFGEIELIQDESLNMGSCIVDTPLGVIDGSLQVRMDNIQREINKILNE